MKEIWTDIPGFPNYSISSLGQIRNKTTDKILKTYLSGRPTHQYQSAKIRTKGREYKLLLHRLMYFSFVGEIPEDCHIDHIDDNRFNNCLSNLQCITHEENRRKKYVKPKDYVDVFEEVGINI